jgi:hypothetical protein
MTTRTTKRSAGEPTWFDLATPDLVTAKNFYHQVFGWEFIDSGPDYGHYHRALAQGQDAAGMMQQQPGDQTPTAWTVYFASDDAAADAARVKELGGQVIYDTLSVGDLGAMAICADPTGAVFGLWQAGLHVGARIEGEHGGMAWCEVNTWDSAAACAFYSALLHATPDKMEGQEYHIMKRGADMLCGVLQMDENWQGMQPHWMGYFAVDNTDAAIERAVAAGGKVAVPAFDMQYGRMAVLADPAGAHFSIVQLPQA